MNQPNPPGPFDDNDRTIIRPMPGGRLNSPTPAPEQLLPPAPLRPLDRPPEAALPLAEVQDNPMIAAAQPLMSLASRLRLTAVYPNIDELRQRVNTEINHFENRLLQAGISADQTRIASYLLCSFLDEAILNTPWGAQSAWGHQSLLISFHKEAWGGEKFFDSVAMMVKQPAQNLALIELAYLFLSLGFEGKYRISANGGNALEKYRTELYQLIQRIKGDPERELSPRWQGLKDVRNALVRYVPLWVVGALLGLLLLLAYLGFVLTLNARSDPLYRQIFGLAKLPLAITTTTMPLAKPVQTGRQERFKRILAKEIAADQVEVVDDRLLRLRNAFDSGSDRLKPEFTPLLQKIAAELVAGKDDILVTGHTDDRPIVSARFPSNWHLSTSRAKKVGDRLSALATLSGQVRFEGRADGEPLVANDTPEHRAVNRRVEIQIQ